MATTVLVMSTIPALGSTNESEKLRQKQNKKKKKALFNIYFSCFSLKRKVKHATYSVPIMYLEETVVDPIGESYDIFGK